MNQVQRYPFFYQKQYLSVSETVKKKAILKAIAEATISISESIQKFASLIIEDHIGAIGGMYVPKNTGTKNIIEKKMVT